MKKRNTKQVILPLITSFIWGSSFVAQSLGAGKVGGFTFTAARSIPAVLVLGALVLILRRVRHEEKYTPQQKKDLLEGGLVCGIFLTLGTNLQQFGIADTTAGKAGFITALYIVLVPLAGMFLGEDHHHRELHAGERDAVHLLHIMVHAEDMPREGKGTQENEEVAAAEAHRALAAREAEEIKTRAATRCKFSRRRTATRRSSRCC